MHTAVPFATPLVTPEAARAAAAEAARLVRRRSASVLNGPADGSPEGPAVASPFTLLSDRERQVVGLIADGLSLKEAALRLHVSVKTIETHRSHAFQKLGLSGVAELTKYAVRQGLSPLGE